MVNKVNLEVSGREITSIFETAEQIEGVFIEDAFPDL